MMKTTVDTGDSNSGPVNGNSVPLRGTTLNPLARNFSPSITTLRNQELCPRETGESQPGKRPVIGFSSRLSFI